MSASCVCQRNVPLPTVQVERSGSRVQLSAAGSVLPSNDVDNARMVRPGTSTGAVVAR